MRATKMPGGGLRRGGRHGQVGSRGRASLHIPMLCTSFSHGWSQAAAGADPLPHLPCPCLLPPTVGSHRCEGIRRVAQPLYQDHLEGLHGIQLSRDGGGSRRDNGSQAVQVIREMGDDKLIQHRFLVGLSPAKRASAVQVSTALRFGG